MTPEARTRVIRMNVTLACVFATLVCGLPAILQAVIGHWGLSAAFLMLGLAMVLFTYALAARTASRSRIAFGDGTYTVGGAFGSRRFTVADVARAVTVDHMSLGRAQATHHLIVAGHRTRLLHLVGQMWDTDQLSALALDLSHRGVPLTPFHHRITAAQLRAHDRRLVPAWQARPMAFALLIALGVLLLAVVGFVVAIALLT